MILELLVSFILAGLVGALTFLSAHRKVGGDRITVRSTPRSTAGQVPAMSRLLPKAVIRRSCRHLLVRHGADLRAAGNKFVPDELVAAKYLHGGIGFGVGLAVFSVDLSGALAAALLAAFLGSRPVARMKQVAAERRRSYTRLLPSALDLVSLGIEAGLSFDRSFALYCAQFDNQISDSFQKVLDGIALGKPRRQALEELSQSTGVEALTSCVAAVLRADKLGVQLVQTLRDQADLTRATHSALIGELSAKAPVKMLGPIAGLILPSLLIVIIGPAILQFL